MLRTFAKCSRTSPAMASASPSFSTTGTGLDTESDIEIPPYRGIPLLEIDRQPEIAVRLDSLVNSRAIVSWLRGRRPCAERGRRGGVGKRGTRPRVLSPGDRVGSLGNGGQELRPERERAQTEGGREYYEQADPP